MSQEDKDIAALNANDILLLSHVYVACSTINGKTACKEAFVPKGLGAASRRLSRLGLLYLFPSRKDLCRTTDMGVLAMEPVLVGALKEFCVK